MKKFDVYRIAIGDTMREVRSASVMGAIKKALPSVLAASCPFDRAVPPVKLPRTVRLTIIVDRIQSVY